MENASRGFLDAVRRWMRQVREVVGAATIDPALLTAAERIQYEGYCGGRRRMRPSPRALKQAFRYARSANAWATAVRLCVPSYAESALTSSGSDKALSTPICPGSMPSGMLAAATRPSSGAGRRDRASKDRCAWSGNGRRGDSARSRPRLNGCSSCRRHEPRAALSRITRGVTLTTMVRLDTHRASS